MITPEYVGVMSRYNRWQNRSIYAAADTLNDAARRLDRGAFFGSIHATLSHLLWGDMMWMHRLAGTLAPKAAGIPQSTDEFPDWSVMSSERAALDDVIVNWARGLELDGLEGELSWFSGAVGRQVSRSRGLLVAHMFNHQTHHRGQVHAMLTAAGARPDDTDLPFMPDD